VAVDQKPEAQVAAVQPSPAPVCWRRSSRVRSCSNRHGPNHLVLGDPQAATGVAVPAIVAVVTAVARAGAFQGPISRSEGQVA